MLDEFAVAVRIAGVPGGIPDAPVVQVQEAQVLVVGLTDTERKLEPLPGLHREAEKTDELVPLCAIVLPLENGLLSSPPVSHGRKALEFFTDASRPLIQDHRRKNRLPVNAPGGDCELGLPDVLSHSEEEVMQLDCHLILMRPDLGKSRVQIDVSPVRDIHERGVKRQMSADVYQQIGIFYELQQSLLLDSEATFAAVVCDAVPVLKPKTAGRIGEPFDQVIQAVRMLQPIYRLETVHPESFHSEFLQAQHILQVSPGVSVKLRNPCCLASSYDDLEHSSP